MLAQPKRVALLAYLAFDVRRSFHSRDTVLALLWPELDQAHARAALSKAIHYLRKALGADTIATRGDDAVGLNWDAVWCDVQAFESAMDAGALEQAVDMYTGPLLDGFYLTGVPGWAAITMPQMPPSDVPTQLTGPPITASRCESAVT